MLPTHQTGPVLCCDNLVGICSGDQEFAATMLDKFKHSSPAQVVAIRDAFTGDDSESMKATAHSLKGAAAVMGAISIADKAAEIEQIAISGDIETAEPVIDQLQELVAQLSSVAI